jgi:hypothetical protein
VQLSTEPVDDEAALAWLRQAYTVAGPAPPQRNHWLDGPSRLYDVLAAHGYGSNVEDPGSSASICASVKAPIRASTITRVGASI